MPKIPCVNPNFDEDAMFAIDQEAIQAREFKASEERQLVQDLAKILQTPEGARAITAILAKTGIGRHSGASEAQAALRNLGLDITAAIAKAAPQTGASIIARLHGLGCV